MCIYGKFEKNTNNIDVEEIIRASHTGFVFIVDNNKNSYYRDPIGGTVFIRKNYFDKFLEGHTVKYFAFTERFIPETGYAEETSLHFEIVNGQIVKEIKFRYRTSQKCACGTWNYR